MNHFLFISLRILPRWPSSIFPRFAPLALALLTSAAALPACAATCVPPAAGMISWWPGDGDASDFFSSNDGVLQGGATATNAGMVSSCFSFDGTNAYVQIADSPALRPTNLSIECWVRFDSLDSAAFGPSPAGQQYIVFRQNTRSANFEGFSLSKTRVSGRDYFDFIVTPASGAGVELVSTTAISTGVWYHAAGVRGSNFVQLYVNGQLQGQAAAAAPQDYGSYPLYFGSTGQSYYDHKLNGDLDEVSLYNRPLSSNEIAAIYTAGTAGKCKGLSITIQPQSQSVVLGGTAAFTVSADGSPPPAYQWLFEGTPLPGATGSSLTFTNVQTTNAGNYTVIVSNLQSSVTSAVAVLTVLVPPTITAQPQNLGSPAGSTATFSGAAEGTLPLSYFWFHDGLMVTNDGRIGGATSAALVISNVQPTDAGNYVLLVTNVAGSATSATASLAITGPPLILSQPASQTAFTGAEVAFSVVATGTTPLAYAWQFNGQRLREGGQFSGVAAAALVVHSTTLSNAGTYSVIVSNSVGVITSQVAVLTVLLAPDCQTPPPGLVGWWAGDGNARDLVGTNNGIFQGNANANAFGMVGQAFGFDGTNDYIQIPDSPVFHPDTLSIEVWVRFDSYQTPGTSAYTNQQYIVFKQNSASYEFEGFALTKDHDPQGDVFLWEVADAHGTLIRIDSVNTVVTGAWYHAVGVRGSNYVQLWMNGNLEAQTNVDFPQDYGTLPLYFGTSGQSYYDRRLHGQLDEVCLYNRALSSNEIVACYLAGSAGKCKGTNGLTLGLQPLSQTVPLGTNVSFSISAAGPDPITYQWRFNGTNLPGATSTTLALMNVQLADAGVYSVAVTNPAGLKVGGPATLAVFGSPLLLSPPQLVEGFFSFSFPAQPGVNYIIEKSTNLLNWVQETVLSDPGGSGSGTLSFFTSATNQAQFYRARIAY